MHQYFPLTLQLAPVEYAALHDFCQAYATWAVTEPVERITNTHLLLADLYKRLFTPARYTSFTAIKRRTSGKRYPVRLGIIYARTLVDELTRQTTLHPLLVYVLSELHQRIDNGHHGTLLGIKHSS